MFIVFATILSSWAQRKVMHTLRPIYAVTQEHLPYINIVLKDNHQHGNRCLALRVTKSASRGCDTSLCNGPYDKQKISLKAGETIEVNFIGRRCHYVGQCGNISK